MMLPEEHDGAITEKNSYGNDPNAPKDRNHGGTSFEAWFPGRAHGDNPRNETIPFR